MESKLRGYRAPVRGSSNSSSILNPITSAPNRIFNSRIPNAKAFGNEPLGTADGSSGNLHEKLQCGQAMGISRISSGETVSRDLHLWHSNVIARISSSPTTILRSKVTLPEVYHANPQPPPRERQSPDWRSDYHRATARFRGIAFRLCGAIVAAEDTAVDLATCA